MAAAAGEHPLIKTEQFHSPEELVIYLMHRFAYEEIARRIGRVSAVLDLGCNIGYGIPVLRRAADRVTGADVSPAAVSAAIANLAGTGTEIVLIGENAPLPFPDASFDAVASCQVIEHVTDVERYLREIRRVLKPGGSAYLTTPNRQIRLDPGMKPWNPHHLREYAAADLAQAVARVFPDAEVLGLRALPEIEAVERRRCDDARARARDAGPPGFRDRLKAMLPPPVRAALKAALAPLRRRPGPAAGLPAFSTADFHYRSDALDDALDLLAVVRTA